MIASEGSLRDRQRAQIRADIRRAAFRLFIERGYDAVTTEEIATAAGVSPRTFFRHVPTKEELLLAPVRHGGAAIVILLEQRPASESPDVALINAIITRTRSFDEADTEEWREALLVAPDLLDKLTVSHTRRQGAGDKADRRTHGHQTPIPTSVPACWSNSPLQQPISPSSSGCANPPTVGRWIATSPKPWKRSRVPTGKGSRNRECQL